MQCVWNHNGIVIKVKNDCVLMWFYSVKCESVADACVEASTAVRDACVEASTAVTDACVEAFTGVTHAWVA